MFIYFDFEYRNNRKTEDIILLSYMTSSTKVVKKIDLRASDAQLHIHKLVSKFQDYIWVAYNAQADLTCLETFEVDISALRVIDPMVEAKMILLTHSNYFGLRYDLLSVCRVFNIPVGCSRDFKSEVREIILNQRQYDYRQWAKIRLYGSLDVEPLPKLLDKLWQVHTEKNTQVSLEDMIRRGEYIKATTLFFNASRGFDVDVCLLEGIFQNKTEFIRTLQTNINQRYGPLYLDRDSKSPMSWSHSAFEQFVAENDYHWRRTESGKQLCTTKRYFKEKSRQYAELMPLYQTRKTIDALKATDLRKFEANGAIKPVSIPFNQKTGRNSPKPSKGFLLNQPPWMRSIIKPSPDNVLISVDWEQQEVAIAADLSGDERYQQAYNSDEGDIYLALGKMSGAIPTEATKESHPIERQTFKAVQLGLGYGKGLSSLSLDVYAANRDNDGRYLLTMSQAREKAEAILTWHKQTFCDYWDWVKDNVTRARVDGFLRSLDGWIYFVDSSVKDTQILNFPMQSNGAAMMRRAVILAYERKSFDLVCTLHDALYANSSVDKQDFVISEIKQCMNQACEEILSGSVTIRTDVSIYDSKLGYRDPRGEAMLEQVKAFLNSRRQR